MCKIIEKTIERVDSQQTISGKLLVLRQVASLVVVVTSLLNLFNIPLGNLVDDKYTFESLLEYPYSKFVPFALFLLPVFYGLIDSIVRSFINRSLKEEPIALYSVLGDTLVGLWTLYYLVVSVCYFERYRMIGLSSDVDTYVMVFSIIHLLLAFFFYSYSDSKEITSKVLHEDYSTPFCDSHGNPIFRDDHVYCNGLEYSFSRVKSLTNTQNDEWIIEPLYANSLASNYNSIRALINSNQSQSSAVHLADALLSDKVDVVVKNDASHRIKGKLERIM